MIFLNPIQFIIVSIIHENLAAFGSTITGGHLIKNRISPTHVILAKNNIGPTICVRNCLVVNKCTAVNYIRAERRCELLNDISSINTLQEKDGCDYTKMASWQMVCNLLHYQFIRSNSLFLNKRVMADYLFYGFLFLFF